MSQDVVSTKEKGAAGTSRDAQDVPAYEQQYRHSADLTQGVVERFSFDPKRGPMPGAFSVWYAPTQFATPPLRVDVESFDQLSQLLSPGPDGLRSTRGLPSWSKARGYGSLWRSVDGRYAPRIGGDGRAFGGKSDAPLLFAGGYVDDPRSKGADQLDHGRYPPFLLMESDGVDGHGLRTANGDPSTLEEARADVAAMLPGIRYDLWTSYSHGAEGKGCRIRLLIPLTRAPADSREYALCWRAINDKAAGIFSDFSPDQTCFDATRGSFWPCAAPERTPYHFREGIGGGALDTEWLLAYARHAGIQAAKGRHAVAPTDEERAASLGTRVLEKVDLVTTLTRVSKVQGHAASHATEFLSSALLGRPLANADSRNAQIVQGIYSLLYDHPDASPASIYALCAQTFRQTGKRGNGGFYDEEYVLSKCRETLPKVLARRRDNTALISAAELDQWFERIKSVK